MAFLDETGLATLWSRVKEKCEVKKVSITFAASSWVISADGYQQTVTVKGGTANSLVSLQPTAAQIVTLQRSGVLALMVDNDNGTFIAKSVGAAPSATITIQATITDVAT